MEAYSPDTLIQVKNGCCGRLCYRSRKTGELFIWERFGDVQDMEFSELKNARASWKKYFINNWFLFPDPAVPAALGVERYYKNAIPPDGFDAFLRQPAARLRASAELLSPGQRKTAAARASELIASGEIDSVRRIALLREVFNLPEAEET